MAEVLSFPEGLIGFRAARRFVLLDSGGSRSPFRRLVSLDVPELAFVVCDPRRFWPGYEIELLPSDDDRGVLVIVTVPGDARDLTANLMAPLVVDPRTGTGRQVVVDTGRYSTRHPLPAPVAALA